MGDVQLVLGKHPAPEVCGSSSGGQYESQQQAFRALLLVLALAAISVCAVMVVQLSPSSNR